MDHEFWQARWEQGQLGFHQSQTHPELTRYFPSFQLSGARVLVPLCGKSLDLDWLVQEGHEVVGVEFVEEAVRAYFAERGLEAERTEWGGLPAYRSGKITLIQGDFYAVRSSFAGQFDAAYDRAAWVAIAPSDREKYVERMRDLLRPGARLLLLNFEHDLRSGPPHSIPEQEVKDSWRGFSLELVSQQDLLPREPRFAERGATRFVEQVWSGTCE